MILLAIWSFNVVGLAFAAGLWIAILVVECLRTDTD